MTALPGAADGIPSAGFSPADRLSCSGCGFVYDPAAGDRRYEVPPGTPFARLPTVWRCPGCGAAAHRFFAIPAGMDPLDARLAALEAAHRHVAGTDMAGLAVCNPHLSVEAVGFRPFGPGWVGCLIAPWTLNVVVLPADAGLWAGLNDGDKELLDTPAGQFAVTAARLGALGVAMTIPAVSDMTLFSDQEDARAAGMAALDALLLPKAEETGETADEAPPEPALPAPPPAVGTKKPKDAVSRRSLFRRGG